MCACVTLAFRYAYTLKCADTNTHKHTQTNTNTRKYKRTQTHTHLQAPPTTLRVLRCPTTSKPPQTAAVWLVTVASCRARCQLAVEAAVVAVVPTRWPGPHPLSNCSRQHPRRRHSGAAVGTELHIEREREICVRRVERTQINATRALATYLKSNTYKNPNKRDKSTCYLPVV
jgi:hypothetical protein